MTKTQLNRLKKIIVPIQSELLRYKSFFNVQIFIDTLEVFDEEKVVEGTGFLLNRKGELVEMINFRVFSFGDESDIKNFNQVKKYLRLYRASI